MTDREESGNLGGDMPQSPDGRYGGPPPPPRGSRPDTFEKNGGDDHAERIANLEAIVGEPPAPALGRPGHGLAKVVTVIHEDVTSIKTSVGELADAQRAALDQRQKTLAPWKNVLGLGVAAALGGGILELFHWISTLHH